MMKSKKSSKIALTVAGSVMGALAVAVGLFGLIPKMREKCKEKCKKLREQGLKPPAFCMKMMGKCCGLCLEEKEE